MSFGVLHSTQRCFGKNCYCEMLGVVGIDTSLKYATVLQAQKQYAPHVVKFSGQFDDELHFDDFMFYDQLVTNGLRDVKICAVRILWKGHVFGTQISYLIREGGPGGGGFQKVVTAPGHFYQQGFYARGGLAAYALRCDQTFHFAEDEYLESVFVQQDVVVIAITFVTNKRSYRCDGGANINHAEPNGPSRSVRETIIFHKPTPKSTIVGFCGAAHGVLRRFGVWYRPHWVDVRYLILLRELVQTERANVRQNTSLSWIANIFTLVPFPIFQLLTSYVH